MTFLLMFFPGMLWNKEDKTPKTYGFPQHNLVPSQPLWIQFLLLAFENSLLTHCISLVRVLVLSLTEKTNFTGVRGSLYKRIKSMPNLTFPKKQPSLIHCELSSLASSTLFIRNFPLQLSGSLGERRLLGWWYQKKLYSRKENLHLFEDKCGISAYAVSVWLRACFWVL